MYVRLAFAVAAHLEPEILLVDEVLAVGDINFQKKCLGKMGDVAKAGRTVVLVSHQLNQIRRLSDRVIWVDEGQIRMNGSPQQVLAAYESAMAAGERSNGAKERFSGKARFLKWGIASPRAEEAHVLSTIGPVTVSFEIELTASVANGEHGVALFNADRQLMWAQAAQNLTLGPGIHTFSHEFPSLPLRPGAYQWQVSLLDEGTMLDLWDCLPEMVIATETNQHYQDGWNGILNLPRVFSVQG
jgi:lipopolysaccharide transport system ATP-binding protein